MMHRRVEIEKQDFMKYFSKKGDEGSTYLTVQKSSDYPGFSIEIWTMPGQSFFFDE